MTKGGHDGSEHARQVAKGRCVAKAMQDKGTGRRGHVHEKEGSGQQMKMKKGNKTHQVAALSRHTFISGKGTVS